MRHASAKQKPVAEHIGSFFADFYAELQRQLAKLTGKANKIEFSALSTDAETVKEIARLFTEALEGREARESAVSGEGGKAYSIETLANGMKFVFADRNIIRGTKPSLWTQQLLEFFDSIVNEYGYLAVPTDEGDTILITTAAEQFKNTAGKVSSFDDGYLYDEYGNFDKKKAGVKARATAQLDELLEIGQDKKPEKPNAPDRNPEGHQDFASEGWRYKTAYFMDVDGSYYKISMSVAYGSDGKIRAYNIGSVTQRARPDLTGSSLSGAPVSRPRSHYNMSSPSDSVNPSRKNSLPTSSVTPEQDEDLYDSNEEKPTINKAPIFTNVFAWDANRFACDTQA